MVGVRLSQFNLFLKGYVVNTYDKFVKQFSNNNITWLSSSQDFSCIESSSGLVLSCYNWIHSDKHIRLSVTSQNVNLSKETEEGLISNLFDIYPNTSKCLLQYFEDWTKPTKLELDYFEMVEGYSLPWSEESPLVLD